MAKKGLSLILILFLLVACGGKKEKIEVSQENTEAKKWLQGIWLDTDGTPSFRASGDSIFYPDSTSMPVRFKIVADTLVLEGGNTVKYPIVKQAPHLFEFKNQNGELVKLVKSESQDDQDYFETKQPVVLNQRQTIKRDTVVMANNERYHCYVQVNPTTYKVYKTSYNDDGVEVDNVYYDNSIHVAVFNGNRRVYTHDFHKQDFSKLVPKDFLRQSVLSDMQVTKVDAESVHYMAQLAIPDSPSSYLVDVAIGYQGKMAMSIINE